MALRSSPAVLVAAAATARAPWPVVSGSNGHACEATSRLATTRTDGHCGLESGDDGRELVQPSALLTVMHDT